MKKMLIALLACVSISACCKCDCPAEEDNMRENLIPTPASTPVYYMKQPVSFDGAEYTINSIQVKSEEKIEKPFSGVEVVKPENKFLVVNITLKNNGTEAIKRLPEIQLIDQEGRKFDQIDSLVSFWHPKYLKIQEKLNPLASKTGVLIFDVPENNEYKLLISPDILSDIPYPLQIELKDKPQN